MTTLYNLRHSGDPFNFIITKFVDGEVESSYELAANLRECACPAGHRPSCRHRQMAPMMLASGIIDTHYFWDYDLNRAVDFNGTLKSNFDAMEELAYQGDEYTREAIAEREHGTTPVAEAPLSEPQRGEYAGKRLPFNHGRHEGQSPEPLVAEGPPSEVELVCVNGHDRCYEGPTDNCPYCERRPHSPTATTTGFDPVDTGSIPVAVAKPWRRL